MLMPMNRPLLSTSWIPLLAIIVISLFCCVLCVGVFIPAYIDDILYLMANARAGYDGWQSISVYPQCSADFAMAIPLTLLPGRAWLWVVHLLISDFYSLRLTTLFVFVFWVAYTAWFIKRCLFPAQAWPDIVAGVIGSVAIGTLPFALLLGRPETPMIFAVTFFTSIPFIVQAYPRLQWRVIAGVALVFFLIASWFLSLHAKALFYIPVLIVSALYLCRWHKAIGLLLTAITAITCWQAVSYWHFRLACPDSAATRYTMDPGVALPSLFFEHNALFWEQFLTNLSHSDLYLLEIILPYGKRWLPDFMQLADFGALPSWVFTAFIALHTCLWAIVTLFLVITVLGLFFYMATGLYTIVRDIIARHGRIRFDLLLPLCLLGACVAQCGFQQAGKIFYNTSLVWVTLVLFCVALAGYLSKYTDYWNTRARGIGKSCTFLMIAAATSLFALLFTYVPATLLMLRGPGPDGLTQIMENGRIHNRGGAIAEQGFGETRKHVLSAARLCHIPTDSSGRHLVVNHFTYFPLKDTYQPLLSLALFHEYKDPQKLFAFLRQRQSAGIVTLCSSLPEKIRPIAKESDGVCCISREQIDSGP